MGGEFLVNSYVTGSQFYPSVAMDQVGDFVVVWISDGSSTGDTSDYSVQGQRFASGGSPVGGEFLVNSYTTSEQTMPSVAVDREGDFVVAWHSNGSYEADSGNSVQVQPFLVTAMIGDRVFLDADFDGRQDATETGVEGIDIHLRDSLGNLLDSAQTNGAGEYRFSPKIGTYRRDRRVLSSVHRASERCVYGIGRGCRRRDRFGRRCRFRHYRHVSGVVSRRGTCGFRRRPDRR